VRRERRSSVTVEVSRGGRPESVHRACALFVEGAGGGTTGEIAFGDPRRRTYWRSSMKPFQALPLVEDGVVEAAVLSPPDLALVCASHAGTEPHVDRVRRLLDRIGLREEHLACGPHAPFDEDAARRALCEEGGYRAVHNNCSGKHAGMLALARHRGWPAEGYHEFGHPVQRRIRESLRPWLSSDPGEKAWGIDGCGVPSLALRVEEMARAYARLGAEAAAVPVRPVVRAMTDHPETVSGPGRPVTRIMRSTEGRVLVKEGAEGVVCAAAPGEGWAVAVKVVDGAKRAAIPALLEVLRIVGGLREEELDALADLRRPEIRNTRDEAVGRIETRAEVGDSARPAGAGGG